MTERILTVNMADLLGGAVRGTLTIEPVGPRPSDPTLVAPWPRDVIIENGAIVGTVRIWSPGEYTFTLVEHGSSRRSSFRRIVEESSEPISLNELYRQPPDGVVNLPAQALVTGDSAGRLNYGAGETGMVWMRMPDGTMALQAVDAGGDGGDAATLAGHAPGYYLDRTNHTGAQEIDTISGLPAVLADKAPLVHAHDDRYYTRAQIDDRISTPPGPLRHWRGARGPGAYVGWAADSLGVGASTPVYPVDGWVQRFARGLQDAYSPGRHPTGRLPIFMSTPFLESESSHFSGYVDVDAGWIPMTNILTGPGTALLRTQTQNAGVRWYHATFTDLAIEHTIADNGFFFKCGTHEIYVDGDLVGAIDASIDPATVAPSTRHAPIVRMIVRGLPNVEHTVEIRHVSNAANIFTGTFGVRCYDPLGVNLDNFSRHDATTDWFGNRLPSESMFDGNFGGYGQPGGAIGTAAAEWYDVDGSPMLAPGYDLLVWAVGINNILKAGYAFSDLRKDVFHFLRKLYEPTSPSRNASLMMVLPSHGTGTEQGVLRSDIASFYRDVAEQYGGRFIDLNFDPVQEEWSEYFVAELNEGAGSPHISNADHYLKRVLDAATE